MQLAMARSTEALTRGAGATRSEQGQRPTCRTTTNGPAYWCWPPRSAGRCPTGTGPPDRRRSGSWKNCGKRGTARSADDLILLAGLYRAEGDEAKTRQTRERMAAEYPANFACTVFLAREALRDHDLPACEKLLPVLRRLGPGQFDGVAVEFQYRVLTGEPEAGRPVARRFHGRRRVRRRRRPPGRLRCANLIYDFLQVHPADDRGPADADLRSIAIRLYRPAGLSETPTPSSGW